MKRTKFKKKGRKQTEETKQKIRMSHIGLKASEETKKKMSKSHKENPTCYWKGKTLSEEHKQKIQETTKKTYENPEIRLSCGRKGREILESQKQAIKNHMLKAWKDPEFRNKLIRENANNWQDGISFKEYGYDFDKYSRAKIYERDAHTCQNPKCERCSSKLDTHHIDYDKKNNAEQNIISLCTSCHTKTNFNRNMWKEFYKNIMEKKYAKNSKRKNSNGDINKRLASP